MAETTTLTLAEFLLERIAEDEQGARDAAAASGARLYEGDVPVGEHWQADRGLVVGAADLWDDEGADSLGMSFEAARHVARWDPARVLAECEAKRRLIEEFTTNSLSRFPDRATLSPWALRMLGLLALPYAEHPSYREEWRP